MTEEITLAFNDDRSLLLKDYPVYTDNPFIEPLIAMKTKRKTVQISTNPQMVLDENGQYIGESYMIVKKKVDKEEFVKVFKSQLALIFELSKTAQKVLTYFIKNLGVNKDFILFDIKKAKVDSTLASKTSIYMGLAELIQNSIIARSNMSSVYYINPAILFNGDRLVVFNAWYRDDKMGASSVDNLEDWPDINKKLIDEHKTNQ